MIVEADKVFKQHKPGLLILTRQLHSTGLTLRKAGTPCRCSPWQMLQLLGTQNGMNRKFLITNQVYMDTTRNTFAGLGGTSLEHISKAIIRLGPARGARVAAGDARQAPCPLQGTSFDFEIVEDGILGAGVTGSLTHFSIWQ